MAEYFLDLNRERTMEGVKAAIARGRKGGRPKKLSESDQEAARALLRAGTIPVAEIAKRLGISQQIFYQYFPAARASGGQNLMPIRAEHRWLYPIDWLQLSAVIRFERAGGRCEHCGRPHGQLVRHLGDGRWWDEQHCVWRDGRGRLVRAALPHPAGDARTTRVYLATAHLDHDPANSHPRNLAALCQRCHLLHDRPEHRRRRRITLRMRKAIGDLFLGLYNG